MGKGGRAASRTGAAGRKASSGRASHVISEREAAEFLRESQYKTLLHHNSSREGIESIERHGIDIERNVNGAFGKGFYLSQIPETSYGEHTTRVAIRTKNPLIVSRSAFHDTLKSMGIGHDKSGRFDKALANKQLRKRGYDSVVLRSTNPSEGEIAHDWVIALSRDNVRIIK